MNLMNINERVLSMCDSLCFVGSKCAIFGVKHVHLGCFCKTNVFVYPKKWFIKVHQGSFLSRLSYKLMNLMNLMNFNELACCLRLFFAMYIKGELVSGINFHVSSSHKFIKFIKNGGLV